eukprot:1617164-Rhodomonas_salina.1
MGAGLGRMLRCWMQTFSRGDDMLALSLCVAIGRLIAFASLRVCFVRLACSRTLLRWSFGKCCLRRIPGSGCCLKFGFVAVTV